MHRPRPLPRHLALAALIALAGCGGARKPVEAPVEAPDTSRPADLGALAILLDPPPPPALKPFAVNPTVAVAARPGLVLAPVGDTHAYEAARQQLADGRVPDLGPEDLVDALADDDPGPFVRAGLAPSPLRPGYHALRIALVPPEAPPPPMAVVVIEAGLDGQATRDVVAGLIGDRQGPPRMALLVAGEHPRWACPPIDVNPAAAGTWAAAARGMDLSGPADVPRALAEARAALPPDGLVVLIGEGPARDPMGMPVARVLPGDDPAELTRALRRRLWSTDVTVELSLDARAVERYRLVGFDGGGSGGRTGALWAGRPTAVLIEVQLTERAPGVALGVVAARGRRSDGAAWTVTAAIEPTPGTDRRAAVAALGAAVVEKLRGAWWARAIDWSALEAQSATLAAEGAEGAETVRWWAREAAALGRPDRFGDDGPPAAMDPHAVPVLRSAP